MTDTKVTSDKCARDLALIAWHEGSNLQGAGYALRTLADLLGADGSEHYLDDNDMNGLLHAVHTIGSAVIGSANKIAVAAELAGGLEVNHG